MPTEFTTVRVRSRRIADYRAYVTPVDWEELHRLAESLAGKRVIQLSSSDRGSDESDRVHALVALAQDLGIRTEWRILSAPRDARVARAADAWFYGARPDIPNARQAWFSLTLRAAHAIEDAGDVCVVHGTGLAGLSALVNEFADAWVWQPHAPLDHGATASAADYLSYFDAALTGDDGFPQAVPRFACRPAIDPRAAQNVLQRPRVVRRLLRKLGVDPTRPLVARASRYAAWNALQGIVAAYRQAKRCVPDLQLVISGRLPASDANWNAYHSLLEACVGDPDIRVIYGVSPDTLAALRAGATLLVQSADHPESTNDVLEGAWQQRHTVVLAETRAAAHPLSGDAEPTAGDLATALVEHLGRATKTELLGALARKEVTARHLMPHLLLAQLRAVTAVTVGGPRAGS